MSAGPAFPPPREAPESRVGALRLGAYRSLPASEGALPVAPPSSRPSRRAAPAFDRDVCAALSDAHARASMHERVDEMISSVPLALAASAAFVAVAAALEGLEHAASSRLVVLVVAALVTLAGSVVEARRRTRRLSLVFVRGHVGVFRRGALELVLRTVEVEHGASPLPPSLSVLAARSAGAAAAACVSAVLAAAPSLVVVVASRDLLGVRASDPAARVVLLGAALAAGIALASELWTQAVGARVVLAPRGSGARSSLHVAGWRLELVAAPR